MIAEYRAAVAATMSERELQDNVVELARTLGYLVFHDLDSRRNAAGFPDLVIVGGGGRLIMAELKAERGKLRPAQVVWLGGLREVAYQRGIIVRLWRPSHWLSGEIERTLRGEHHVGERQSPCGGC